MQLTEHPNENQFFLRHADASSVTVVDRRLQRSFAVSATQVVEDLPVHDPAALAETAQEMLRPNVSGPTSS